MATIMIVTYLRSSSYGCHDMCEMKYYIEYILGHKGPPNIKAEKGTVVHKVMEILAHIKLCQQNNKKVYVDDIAGRITCSKYNLDNIIDKCTKYYKKYSSNKWTNLDVKHCSKWSYKALEYKDGMYDPRNAFIVQPEQAFDITIHQPWSMYEYELLDGSTMEGFLSIKGTIDQVSQVDDDTYRILDWKTGRRLNWATGEEKDYLALNKDAQLMLYFYAAKQLYPNIKNIEIVIYFINDGGPYTICFSDEDIPRIENMIRTKFESIRDKKVPSLNKSWKCTKFCHYGRNSFNKKKDGVQPIIEQRFGQITPKGTEQTMCEQVKYCLQHRDEESVRKNMTKEGFIVDKYKAPGEVEE